MGEMMAHGYLLTVSGVDRPGIAATLTNALFQGGCSLGEASMVRLRGHFTIMMMCSSDADLGGLWGLVEPAARDLKLRVHIDEVIEPAGRHEPNVQISVFGAERAGVVAQVTAALAAAGLNILNLSSVVGSQDGGGGAVMLIDGHAEQGARVLEAALTPLHKQGVEARVSAFPFERR